MKIAPEEPPRPGEVPDEASNLKISILKGVQSIVTGLNNSNANSSDSAQLSGTEQLVEVSVFVSLIVPSMGLSFFAIKQASFSLNDTRKVPE